MGVDALCWRSIDARATRHDRAVAMTGASLSEQRPARNAVFGKFALTMLSSWIVGPAAVLVMHLWGWGSEAILISILLALSVGAPVQLLLNEFIAAGVIANTFRATRVQLGIVITVTFIAIWTALASSTKLNVNEPFAFAYATIAAFSTISVWLSYRVSLRYYRVVVSGAAERRFAIYVGITPGLVTLISFLLAAVARQPVLLLLGAIAPAVAQTFVVKQLSPDQDAFAHGDISVPAPLTWGLLFTVVSAMIAVGFATTMLRDYLAGEQAGFAALILVSLNLLGTVVISFSRASYLTSGRAVAGKAIGYTILFLIGAVALLFVSSIGSALAGLFGLQLLVVVILTIGRRFSEPPNQALKEDVC